MKINKLSKSTMGREKLFPLSDSNVLNSIKLIKGRGRKICLFRNRTKVIKAIFLKFDFFDKYFHMSYFQKIKRRDFDKIKKYYLYFLNLQTSIYKRHLG